MTTLRRAFAVMAAVAALAAPAAAHADWEWTRWGMSADEVVAASGGRVSRSTAGPDHRVHGWDRLAEGVIDYDGVAVNAQFYFDPAGRSLHVVRLLVSDFRNCDRLKAAVARRLGPPTSSDGPLEWRDDGRGDFAGVSAIGPVGTFDGICFARFRPVAEEPAD